MILSQPLRFPAISVPPEEVFDVLYRSSVGFCGFRARLPSFRPCLPGDSVRTTGLPTGFHARASGFVSFYCAHCCPLHIFCSISNFQRSCSFLAASFVSRVSGWKPAYVRGCACCSLTLHLAKVVMALKRARAQAEKVAFGLSAMLQRGRFWPRNSTT